MSESDMNMAKALVTLQNNFISIHIYASFLKKKWSFKQPTNP